MAWEHLDVNKPHLVYIILGGFTTLFMLCSSVIKERLYIGEATVATLCGIIFGPHAANLIDPGTWGNTDQITLEFSRIVLVVQCFAVGVELPKAYMERHWRSVVTLLLPVMTFGWLVTSLFIWGLIPNVNWLDSLCIAACVTATDPVLASSVVGKGKFAKRVPKHLRDLLSAESGCNDGMAFPFVYLAIYIINYRHHPNEVALHWFCYTILYECVFGAFYGVVVGYIARRLIRIAHERDIIDRESFLVFYFVLALFCAGSGSILGIDDLLVGFACGVGFSNDGWFTEKTEESHVSNVIDLLINLAFFVYFGTIIPWAQYNSSVIGLSAWRLVVIAILVLFFRRIPIMLALKPIIPDVKTWREALFAGHFGPIGVGAIFVAILARAELETESTTPLAVLPEPGFPHLNIIELIWPITTFLVITSIIVHGSSIAVFTLGKHINTLTLTMSYTKGNEDQNWTDRLPRIQSRSKSSASARRPYDTESDMDEKMEVGVVPRNFLRRQREEDDTSRSSSRRPSRHRSRRSQSSIHGPGGPISQSAIAPMRSPGPTMSRSDSETLAMKSSDSGEGSSEKSDRGRKHDVTGERQIDKEPEQPGDDEGEIYEEGNETVYEDEEGNVLAVEDTREEDRAHTPEARRHRAEHETTEAKRLMGEHDVHHGISYKDDDPRTDEGQKVADAVKHPEGKGKEQAEGGHKEEPRGGHHWRQGLKRMGTGGIAGGINHLRHKEERPPKKEQPEERRGAARAYQYGNTIIVEDEDGEVIKKYDIPNPNKKKKEGEAASKDPAKTRQRMTRMTSYLGMGSKPGGAEPSGTTDEAVQESKKKVQKGKGDERDDARLRFTITSGGRRMSKADFINEIQNMDPKKRARVVEASDAPEAIKEEARADANDNHHEPGQESNRPEIQLTPASPDAGEAQGKQRGAERPKVQRTATHEDDVRGPEGLKLVDSNEEDIPFHDVTGDLHRHSVQHSTGLETPAQRRRREATQRAQAQQKEPVGEEDSEDDGTERVSPAAAAPPKQSQGIRFASDKETPAERRRRLGALGEDEGDGKSGEVSKPKLGKLAPDETAAERRRREGALGHSKDESDSEDDDTPRVRSPGIRFADVPSPSQAREQQQASGSGGADRKKGFFGRLR